MGAVAEFMPGESFFAWAESIAAPTLLVVTGFLALANWPADWRNVLPTPARSAAGVPGGHGSGSGGDVLRVATT